MYEKHASVRFKDDKNVAQTIVVLPSKLVALMIQTLQYSGSISEYDNKYHKYHYY